MRRRLLLLCFTLSLCAYGFALDSGNYLVRNVATGKYWGAANSWGTRASLVGNPEYVTWTKLDDGTYHLESQVNNGGTAYYFNGDYMDNDSPIALTIEQRANGYYTIGNGEIYYGYDGSTTVLGKTETDPTAANVQWEIVSVADATTALAAATQSAPLNATFLIADPNFGRNNRHYDQWTFEASNKNNSGDVTNFCVESWHATFTMSQTVTVPNGVYGLTAQGFYRQDGSDNEHLPVFYLNGATRTFPVRMGTENSMDQTSASFSQGLYTTEPIFVTVTDGTITLGARLEGNTQLWCIWDNFTLMYYGANASAAQLAFDARFSKIIAEANGVLLLSGVSTEGKNKLNEALGSYGQLTDNSSDAAQQAVESQLEEAISYAREGLTLAEQLTTAYNHYGPKLSATAPNDNIVNSLLMSIATALSSKVYESNAQIEGWLADLKTARQQYYPYEYRYWFDNDESTAISDVSTTPGWHIDADLSNLSESFHTFHMQVVDKDDVLSSPVTRHFIKIPDFSAISTKYWFDDNTVNMYTAPQVQGAFDVDVSELSEGFHTIRYQLKGSDGTTSNVASRSFYKVYIPLNSSWRCWFDNDDSTVQTGKNMNQTLLLDVSQLSDGYHVLHIQVDGGARSISKPITKHFVKIPQTIGVDHFTCLFMVDDKLAKQEQVAAAGGVLEWDLDVSALSQGFHRFFVQVVTPSGAASNTYEGFFLRETTNAEFAEMQCVYAIDGAEFYTEAGTLADGTYHFDLDVSALDDGLHRITYMLNNGKGVNTKAQTQFFMKTPLGGNGITEYWYWQNDEADSNAQKVHLPERTDPFSLITLLPVAQKPIRSSLFQFRMEQGKPVIYAKNDIHVRFYDAAGRFTDCTKQYVDERERMEVMDVTLLESGVRATTAKPTENTIKWYKVTAEQGDSLSFKLDRAASIQLFSPSGEELYAASGAEATNWGGCHAEEDGTFYVALHDVTAQQGSTISIDYEHIDKYALFAYTPSKFSSDGTTIMYLEGNGLEFVKSVELVNGETVLRPDTIVSNTTDMLVRFALDRGLIASEKYDLNVFFDNEEGDSKTLCIKKAITLEPANKGDIAVVVLSERRVGDPYPIKVTLKNNGNVGYYGIPLNIAFDDPEKIDEFRFVNFDMLLSDELYDSRLFFAYTDNLVGTGKKGFFLPTLIPYLGPNEEKTLVFGVRTKIAHAKFNFYAWAGDPMFDGMALTSQSRGSKVMRKAPSCTPSNIPDVYDAIDAVDNLTNLPVSPARVARPFIGAGEAISGVIQGSTRAREDAIFDAYGIDPSERDNYRFQYRYCVRSPHDIARDAHPFQARMRAKRTGGNDIDDHAKSDCPKPNPDPIDVYIPGDPNEITGYLAESGSHFMTNDITSVSYDIEFENDPEIANSSAHTIIIENQLDPNVFDLSSFTPKDITIGNKKVELSGDKSFVTTADLRTAIDAIAELRCDYNNQTGKIKWTLRSLDPQTMETTDDIMQGILPVNSGGDGIGHVTYSVDLKTNLSHGTSLNNKASIVFDNNDAIETPTWTNIIDLTAPESHVSDVKMLNDSTASVSISATDDLSKPWRYNVYVQYGSGAWFLGAENVPIDTTASVKVYEGINHGFYTIVTDSAGNVEQKEAQREFTFEVFGSQIDTNTKIDLDAGWNWISHNQQEPLTVDALKPASARMQSQTEDLYEDTHFGWMGDLTELLPTQMYKVQMGGPLSVQLSGRLFNAGFRSVPLYAGWNWLGYPVANTMSPAEALQKLEAEEGDMLIGQDGLTTYSEGQWTGTLLEMVPGLGYMYRSASDKNLFYNATAQASSRRANSQLSTLNSQLPEGWTVDKRKYPNVMGVIAVLMQDETAVEAEQWVIGAFCGAECRGISKEVSGTLMMNVYGQGGEPIRFYAMNCETGEVLPVAETEPFEANVLGTMLQPYVLHIGEPTGICQTEDGRWMTDDAVYDLQGRKVDGMQMKKGIYVTSDRNRSKTQKVIRR